MEAAHERFCKTVRRAVRRECLIGDGAYDSQHVAHPVIEFFDQSPLMRFSFGQFRHVEESYERAFYGVVASSIGQDAHQIICGSIVAPNSSLHRLTGLEYDPNVAAQIAVL